MTVFHFARATLRDGTPLPQAGDELPERRAALCMSGWHGSVRALDALGHAPGPNVALRELHGTIETGMDRFCSSHCRMLTGYVDATAVLCEFAQWCAERAAQHTAVARDAVASRTRLREFSAWGADRAAQHAERAAASAAVTAVRRTAPAAARAAFHAADAARYAHAVNADYATAPAVYAAERDAQEEWLRPRLLALLGQENEG